MKKIKKNLMVICIGMVIILNGCSSGNTDSKIYTYTDLDKTQQQVVDGVYEMYSDWEFVYDSGEKFPCTNVSFFYEDDKLIFATYYTCSDSNDGFGITKVFQVNQENGQLYTHTYNYLFDESENIKRKAATVTAANGEAFPSGGEENSQKDALANAFSKAISKK